MKEVVIGIDIGGTFTKFGLVDKKGEIFEEGTLKTADFIEAGPFIDELKRLIETITEENDYEIKGIGIGSPNGNYHKGTVEFAPNLKWKGIVKLRDLFHSKFNIPAALTNDANAAAMGEMIYGGARGMKDFLMVTLGTGLGSGFVSNGMIIHGHDGFAGELGHTIVDPDGRQCNCGRRGCLETYASVTGIERTVFELLGRETDPSALRNYNFNEIDGMLISQAALNGDALALKAFEETGRILGLKLADSVAYTSPEAIFIFGGLAKSGDLILEPTKKYFEKYLLKIYKGKTNIRLSALQHKNIAVLGAAAIIWNELS